MGTQTLRLNPKAQSGRPSKPAKRPSRVRTRTKKVVVVQAKPGGKRSQYVAKRHSLRKSTASHRFSRTDRTAEEPKVSLIQQRRMVDALKKARNQRELEARQRREKDNQLQEARKRQAEEYQEILRRNKAEELARAAKEAAEEERRKQEKIAAAEAKKAKEAKAAAPRAKPTPAAKTEPVKVRRQVRKQSKPDRTRRIQRGGRRKLNVRNALEGERQRSHAAFRRREKRRRRKSIAPPPRERVIREVQLPETIVVQELANRMAERSADVIKYLMTIGERVTQNQTIDADTAELVISQFGHKVTRVSDSDVEDVIEEFEDSPEQMLPRAPVVTVMGHVDHGKTSLLDYIRNARVAAGESGGITQHIGAYQVATADGHELTFLDTPGHAAFTDMRARGAEVTDIVVLVVAADDSVKPQTIEAINHARAADVPIVVAINKCDRPNADPDRVRNDLLQHSVVVESRSGEVLDAEISAVTGEGIPDLLEQVQLQAELLELKANRSRPSEGTVVEALVAHGKGSVATILIQAGTLRKGDIFVVGQEWGKVRAMFDDKGKPIAEAIPSQPVEVLGLNGTPAAGDRLNVVKSDAQARQISEYRRSLSTSAPAAAWRAKPKDIIFQLGKQKKACQLIIKADVHGSAEAIEQAVKTIGNDEVEVRILHCAVGEIIESDITLATASNATVIGFNVRANAAARVAASQQGVEVRNYSVIYELLDDVRAMATGLLAPKINEIELGNAEILEIFNITGVGPIAGCRVLRGVVRKSSNARLLRDSEVVYEGRLKTLKRFQDDVQEVQSGQECGIGFENCSAFQRGDSIVVFDREEVQQSL